MRTQQAPRAEVAVDGIKEASERPPTIKQFIAMVKVKKTKRLSAVLDAFYHIATQYSSLQSFDSEQAKLLDRGRRILYFELTSEVRRVFGDGVIPKLPEELVKLGSDRVQRGDARDVAALVVESWAA